MPRVQMPMIVGQGGGYYQLIARIYDVLQDYTEVATEIYVSPFHLSCLCKRVVNGFPSEQSRSCTECIDVFRNVCIKPRQFRVLKRL